MHTHARTHTLYIPLSLRPPPPLTHTLSTHLSPYPPPLPRRPRPWPGPGNLHPVRPQRHGALLRQHGTLQWPRTPARSGHRRRGPLWVGCAYVLVCASMCPSTTSVCGWVPVRYHVLAPGPLPLQCAPCCSANERRRACSSVAHCVSRGGEGAACGGQGSLCCLLLAQVFCGACGGRPGATAGLRHADPQCKVQRRAHVPRVPQG
jgi:hypothetical protein